MRPVQTPTRRLALVLLVAAAGAHSLTGQTTPAEPAGTTNQTDTATDRDVIELSPFEVTSSEDNGYYATHTLSGTRFNTRLRDLGSSISVVTPQQLIDTAAVDINDVFMYEGNTEGTHTYTAYSLDRGSINTNTVQQSPQEANRVRGLGSPDRAVDYFISLREIPFDAYNVDRVTINRGPNAILFGLGTASGIINTTPSPARVGQNSNHVDVRIGSWGDFRTAFNLNRTVIDDTLAVRIAGVYHERGYRQEPAHDKTRRGYAAVEYKPLESTRIRASVEKYKNDYRRPNASTPNDFISGWIGAGRPTFNPSTMMITRGDGTVVPVGTAATNQFADAVWHQSYGGLDIHPHNTRAAFLIENGNVFGRYQRQLGTTIGGSNLVEQVVATAGRQPTAIFAPPGISNQELYDWESINILSGNYGQDQADMYQVTLEQEIFTDLFLELGWRREEFERFSLSAQSGSQASIYVDANETLLDGTPNPFFKKPYIEVWEPTANSEFIDNESMRATLAYEYDFTDRESWLRWLGRHNFMGLAEQRKLDRHGFRWREAVISTHEGWAPERDNNGNVINKNTGSNFRTRQNRVYYLGDNGVVTHAPGEALFWPIPVPGADFPEGSVGPSVPQTLRHFIPGTGRDGSTDYGVPGGRPVGQWVSENALGAVILHDTNPPTEQTKIESRAGVWQSYLFNDRIVGTLGWRKDTRKFRRARSPIINEYGFRDEIQESLADFPNDWDVVSGNTSTKGVVIHPLRDWSAIPEWAQGLSFHYNESDTFQPANTERNLFLEILPIPVGTGKDWGVTYATPDDTFIVRVNWFESAQAYSRAGAGLVTGRARRVENEGTWGFVDMIEADIERREGLPENALNAFEVGDPTTAPYLAEIAERSGLTTDFLQYTGGFNDTQTAESEGMEVSIDYNPSRNWNVKAVATRLEAVNSEVAPGAQRWLAGDGSLESPGANSRLALWQNAQFLDPRDGTVKQWWTTEWPGMPSWGRTPQLWYTGVVESLLRQQIRLQGLSNPQVREWQFRLISNYRFTEGFLDGFSVGGSVRWEDEAAIGYMGEINPATGQMDLYDVDRPIYDDAKEYYDFWTSYTTDLFDDRVRMRIQLNIRNAFEDGGLQVFSANPDGRPAGFRIVEPRTFFLTTSFDF